MGENNLILHLEDISFNYPGRPSVLDKLSLSLYQGDRMGLMGSNGSGKSTMFHIVMGLLKPSLGRIEVFGRLVKEEEDFRQVRRRIGLLFQDADDQLFSPTVLEDVAFGPLNLGKSKDEAKTIARRTLSSLGMAGFEDRITHKLSGGEKRLVSLATVLAMGPDVLLLDEPTTGLDEATEERLIDILKGLENSYIVVSHNLDFLLETTKHIACMDSGKISSNGERIPHTHVHSHSHGRHTHDHKQMLR